MSARARFGRDTAALLAPLALLLVLLAPRPPHVAGAVPILAPPAPPAAAAVSASAPVADAPRADAVRALLPAPWAAAPQLRADAPSPPATAAAAVLLLDEASATVLYHEAGHTPLPPASLTKVATAIVAIESGDLDAWVTVDVDSRVMRGSTVMGLLPGDRFTLRDLLYGLILPSGNDAALAIGRHVAGSDAAFVARMNALVDRLGLSEARFANAHGLSAPGHLASAHDLAVLARYAMTLPAFREITGTLTWEAAGSRSIALRNVAGGALVGVDGADGAKSGFTRQAGRTMIVSATRDGHRLYAVVLNDPQREADVARLLAWGFAAFAWADGSVVTRPPDAAPPPSG